MTRQAFLQQIGLGAAFVLTVPCFHACSRDDDGDEVTPQPTDVDFVIDVTAEPYAAHFADRGYTVVDKVVVAQLAGGDYAAASQVCSHQNFETVIYESAADEWFCQTHGARFSRAAGAPQNDVTDNPLRIYTTTLEGDELRVRS